MSPSASAGSLARRVSVASAWTMAARIALAGSGFTINLMLARIMAPEDLGTYFLVLSVVTVLTMMAQMGLQISVVRFAAEAKSGLSSDAAGDLSLKFALIGFASALWVVGLYLLAGHGWAIAVLDAPAMNDHALVVALWVVVSTPLGILAEAFRGSQQYRPAALFGGLSSAIILLFCVLPMFVGGRPVELGLLLNMCVGASISSLLMASFHALAGRTTQRFTAHMPFTAIMQVSLPLMFMSLAIVVTTQADLWVAGAYLSKADVAAYGVAARLVQVVLMPLLVLNAVLGPLIAELHARGARAQLERLLGASSALGSLPGLLMLAVFVAFAESLLGWLYGDGYARAGSCLVLVSAGQLINTCCGPAATVLMMCGRERAVMMVSISSGVLTLCGGMIMAPVFGMQGIAAAAALGSASHGLLCMLWVHRTMGIWTHPNPISLRSAWGELRARTTRKSA